MLRVTIVSSHPKNSGYVCVQEGDTIWWREEVSEIDEDEDLSKSRGAAIFLLNVFNVGRLDVVLKTQLRLESRGKGRVHHPTS